MVPPCFAAPLRTQPLADKNRPLRGNGRTPSQAHCSPARLQDHLRHRAACPVPSFGLSVRRRRGVLFSSQPIYIIISNIRKIGGFVNIIMWKPLRHRCAMPLPGLRLPASASLPLASCWPRPQQLLPVSAAGGGRRRCSQRERLKLRGKASHRSGTPLSYRSGFPPRRGPSRRPGAAGRGRAP